jgi:ankyrin repeat protein
MVTLLLKNGANIDLRNNMGNTALADAAARNHMKCVQLLLKKTPKVRPCRTCRPLARARTRAVDTRRRYLSGAAELERV